MPPITPKRTPEPENLATLIYLLRGEKVLLSEHLAGLYGVSVSALNQAVKRNIERFPDDFMFQLNRAEADAVLASRSQIVTLKRGQIQSEPGPFDSRNTFMRHFSAGGYPHLKTKRHFGFSSRRLCKK